MSVLMLQIIPEISRTLQFIVLFTLAAAGLALLVGFLFKYVRRYGAYAYANARINAMKRALFRKDKINNLVQSQNLQNLVSLLEDSPYSEYLENVKELTPQNTERSFQYHLLDSHRKISVLAPEEIREIFLEMEKIHEVENIKTILIGKFSDIPSEKIEDRLLPSRFLSEELYEKAIEAEDMKEAAAVFKGTEYWGIINESFSEFEETRNILSMWSGLERRYERRVWETARDSEAKHSEVVREVIEMEIDIQNILTVLRCIVENVENEKIEELIVPVHSDKLDSEDLDRAIRSDDVEGAIAALEDSFYGNVLSKARIEYEETGSIFSLERMLKEFLLRKIRTLSVQYYTGVGPLIAFFHEKNTEVRNLTAIVNGKSEGLESERIEEKLLTPEVSR